MAEAARPGAGSAVPAAAPLDAESFADWVRPHLAVMARLAARLDSPPDAPDIVQDALARAWQVRGRFDPQRGTVSSFLLAIVADQVRQRRRRRVFGVGRWRDAADELTDVPAEPDAPADVDLARALALLPERQRLAIDCVYFAGLSVAEAAAVMRCAEGTVKSTLSDARARLRSELEET